MTLEKWRIYPIFFWVSAFVIHFTSNFVNIIFSQCVFDSFLSPCIDQNRFSGNIPASFCHLDTLRSISLGKHFRQRCMINNSIEMNLISHKCFLWLSESNNFNGLIPLECFENSNVTYFDVGKDFYVLVHANFCVLEAKVIKYFICIGNNRLTGSISKHIESMKNVKILFLGKKFLFWIFKYFVSSCRLLTTFLSIWIQTTTG